MRKPKIRVDATVYDRNNNGHITFGNFAEKDEKVVTVGITQYVNGEEVRAFVDVRVEDLLEIEPFWYDLGRVNRI